MAAPSIIAVFKKTPEISVINSMPNGKYFFLDGFLCTKKDNEIKLEKNEYYTFLDIKLNNQQLTFRDGRFHFENPNINLCYILQANRYAYVNFVELFNTMPIKYIIFGGNLLGNPVLTSSGHGMECQPIPENFEFIDIETGTNMIWQNKKFAVKN